MSAGHEARDSERVIVRHWVAVGAEQAAECGGPYLLDGGVYRTKIGPAEPEPDMGSSSMTGWEEFGRLHLARTVLNCSQLS
jgi:hypothetical protein